MNKGKNILLIHGFNGIPKIFYYLKKELENLTTVVRPEVVADIKEARAQGDLSENAEYHAAREKQSIVEARIKELEYLIEHTSESFLPR